MLSHCAQDGVVGHTGDKNKYSHVSPYVTKNMKRPVGVCQVFFVLLMCLVFLMAKQSLYDLFLCLLAHP